MPFSKKFMERAPALAAAGLIRPTSTTAFSKGMYVVPVHPRYVKEVGSKDISPTHQGQMSNCIDFFVPEGIMIRAAADGVVIEMKKDSNTTGMELSDWDKGNHVEIEHPQFKEYSWYEHLQFDKVFVKVGDAVREGDIIGLSGNTGFSELPHLHFQVHVYPTEDWLDFLTLKARFKSILGLPNDPYYKND